MWISNNQLKIELQVSSISIYVYTEEIRIVFIGFSLLCEFNVISGHWYHEVGVGVSSINRHLKCKELKD